MYANFNSDVWWWWWWWWWCWCWWYIQRLIIMMTICWPIEHAPEDLSCHDETGSFWIDADVTSDESNLVRREFLPIATLMNIIIINMHEHHHPHPHHHHQFTICINHYVECGSLTENFSRSIWGSNLRTYYTLGNPPKHWAVCKLENLKRAGIEPAPTTR